MSSNEVLLSDQLCTNIESSDIFGLKNSGEGLHACGKFWKRWEYQTTWPASWEICMQVRKQQLELDMEQQTGSK